MKKTKSLLLTILFIVLIITIKKSSSQVTDYDGNIYKTVKIGDQVWMAENLKVEHYRNGEIIQQVQNQDKWGNVTIGAWSYYDNDGDNGKTYGKLYNWYAVNDLRGLAPGGWHIPSDEEWTQLIDYLGGKEVAGGKMKAKILWNSQNIGATNESGFTALPCGFRYNNGNYYDVGNYCTFWSSSEINIDNAWHCDIRFNDSRVGSFSESKIAGLSVRCVKD